MRTEATVATNAERALARVIGQLRTVAADSEASDLKLAQELWPDFREAVVLALDESRADELHTVGRWREEKHSG